MGKVLRIPEWNGNNVPQKQLDRVPLISFGNYSSTTIDISPYKWTDFTEGLVTSARSASSGKLLNPCWIQPEVLYANPTSWKVEVGYNDSGASYLIEITATGDSTASVNYTNGSAINIGYMTGLRKRTVTENNSVEVLLTDATVIGGDSLVSGNIGVGKRYEVKLPPEFYDQMTGLIKLGVKVAAEIYNNSGTGEAEYGDAGWYFTSTAYGTKAGIVGGKCVVQTGAGAVTGVAINSGSPLGNTATIASTTCRVVAILNEKTAISVPVGDKGYGGLVKTTLATAIADFTVPTVINFDSVAVTAPLKVTQDATNDTLSINQIGIWETTGNINLGFDTAVGDRQITVEIWNETLGELAAETTRYIARNQAGDSIPFTIGAIEIQNTSHEYSLRIYSADSFSNVVINKCRWDVKLYSPL